MRARAPACAALAVLTALLAVGCSHLPLHPLRHWERELPSDVQAAPSLDLAAPPALRARSDELRAVPLRWKPVLTGRVAGYVIERAPEGQDSFGRIAVVPGQFAMTWVDRDPTLGDGATYRYRVRSVGAEGGVGTPVSPVAEATTAAVPASPRGLEAVSHLPRRVALQWRAARDPRVVGYVVERSPAQDGPFLTIARLDGRFRSAYLDDGLGDLRVFYYRVAAVNAAGAQGDASDPVQAVTKAEPLPPIGLRVADKRLGANHLVWEPNVEEDVAGYRLLRRREGADRDELVTVLGPDEVEAKDTGVGAGEVVTYQVVAFDVDGLESDPSDPVEVHSEGYGLHAEAATDGISLEWRPRPEEGFVAARVFRLGWLGRRERARVEGGHFVDTDVEPGDTYRYAVVLERSDGSRAPASRVVEAALPAGDPP